jgi:RNA polymerase sigma factor (sigma-70 family)
MISMKEAQDLMAKFISLRGKIKSNKIQDIQAFKNHERLCIEKFQYLVSMRTEKYRGFHNYDDLNQEGCEALVKAMKNYNIKRGNFFWWAHKYISTRISRSANLHTTIRYPLKYAKMNTPHRETILPLLIEYRFCPDKNLENTETSNIILSAMKHLNRNQKKVVKLIFGLAGDKPYSVNKICKTMNISRMNCIKTIDVAMDILKKYIKL